MDEGREVEGVECERETRDEEDEEVGGRGSPPQADELDSMEGGRTTVGVVGGLSTEDGSAGVRAREVDADPPERPPPSEANVLKAPVAPVVMALRPNEAVLGMMVTGRRRTLVKPARTFFLTCAGFCEARKVGSDMARSEAVCQGRTSQLKRSPAKQHRERAPSHPSRRTCLPVLAESTRPLR